MAGEAVGLNLPTFQLNAASEAARNAEYAGDPFTDADGDGTISDPYLGCNRAGSCAPGIGIQTGNIAAAVVGDLTFEQWTLLDQAGAAREPQDSQHLGGDGLGDGDETNNPIQAIDDLGVDFNDQLAFVVADTQAAPGVEFDTGSGAVNRTNKTIEIGEVAWGTVPVA